MKLLSVIFLFFSLPGLAQTWNIVSFDAAVKFEFPENRSRKDSAGFVVYSGKTPEGLFRALRTRSEIVLFNDGQLIDLFDSYRAEKLYAGGELVLDEVIEFQHIKTARYAIQKRSNDLVVTDHYLTFYHRKHFYIFQYTTTSNAPSDLIWSNDFYNGIAVSHPAVPDIIKPATVFRMVQFVPLFILVGTILLTVFVLKLKRGKLF